MVKDKKYTEKDLDNLINSKLDTAINCDKYNNICRKMENKDGRNKIFTDIKDLLISGEFDNLDGCITHIEIALDE